MYKNLNHMENVSTRFIPPSGELGAFMVRVCLVPALENSFCSPLSAQGGRLFKTDVHAVWAFRRDVRAKLLLEQARPDGTKAAFLKTSNAQLRRRPSHPG